jgi:hypothetical protein
VARYVFPVPSNTHTHTHHRTRTTAHALVSRPVLIHRKYCCCCCCLTYYEREGERRLTHAGFLEILGEEVRAVTQRVCVCVRACVTLVLMPHNGTNRWTL